MNGSDAALSGAAKSGATVSGVAVPGTVGSGSLGSGATGSRFNNLFMALETQKTSLFDKILFSK